MRISLSPEAREINDADLQRLAMSQDQETEATELTVTLRDGRFATIIELKEALSHVSEQ